MQVIIALNTYTHINVHTKISKEIISPRDYSNCRLQIPQSIDPYPLINGILFDYQTA